MGGYRPLVVTALIEDVGIPEFLPPALMRMNLVESSQDDPRIIFFASGSHIKVHHFATLTPTAPPSYTCELVDPREAANPNIDKTINQIRVGHLGQDEVLVVVDEAGDVCIWFTQNLSRDPLLFNVDESAWGIDIHRQRSIIAISSNAHVTTLFHCKADSFMDSYSDEQGSSSNNININNNNTSDQPPLTSFKQVLRGHDHNIPTIGFSPCGQFLASASVDRSCRVWRISDGQQVARTPLGPLWGWAVNFIPQDGWIQMTLDQFKRLPKQHLWPEAEPGIGVKRLSRSVNENPDHLRRSYPFGMERFFQRAIGTRWYAGPLEGEPDLGLSGDSDNEQHNQQQMRQRRRRRTATDDDGNMISEDDSDEDALDIDFYLDQMDQMLQVQLEGDLMTGDGDDVSGQAAGEPLSPAVGTGTDVSTGHTAVSASPSTVDNIPGPSSTDHVSGPPPRPPSTQVQGSLEKEQGHDVCAEPSTVAARRLQPPQQTGSGTSMSDIRIITSGGHSRHVSHERVGRTRSHQRQQGEEERPFTAHKKRITIKGKARVLTKDEREAKDGKHAPRTRRHSGSPLSQQPQHRRRQCSESNTTFRRQRHHENRTRRYPSELLLCATARNIYVERCGPFVAAEQASNLAQVSESDLSRRHLGEWLFEGGGIFDDGDDEDVYENDTDGSHGSDDYNDEDEESGTSAPWESAFYDHDGTESGAYYDWVSSMRSEADEEEEGDEDDLLNDYWDDDIGEASEQDGDDQSEEAADDTPVDRELGHPSFQSDHVGPASRNDEEDEEDEEGSGTDMKRRSVGEEEQDNSGAGLEESQEEASGIRQTAVGAAEHPHLKRQRPSPINDSNGEPLPTNRQRRRPLVQRQRSTSPYTGEDGDSDDNGSTFASDYDRDDINNDDEPITLYPISVARSAAARGDSRRIRQLDQFDRLIALRVVPELGIAIAGSQKGTVVVLRLLSIRPTRDDHGQPDGREDEETRPMLDPTENTTTHGPTVDTSGSVGAAPPLRKASTKMKGNSKKDTGAQPSSSKSTAATSSTSAPRQQPAQGPSSRSSDDNQRPRHVLFPEVYLPALDPMPAPLMGISVSPLLDAAQRTTVGVLLHIVYVNGRLFSYEIRVGKQSHDPPSLDQVFL